MTVKVVLDTNFLMIPYQFGVDIFAELTRVLSETYTLVVVDKTIDELKILQNTGKDKESAAAKVALSLLEVTPHEVIEADRYADDAIALLAQQDDVIVATLDRDLRKRCRKCVVLRQKNHLDVIGV